MAADRSSTRSRRRAGKASSASQDTAQHEPHARQSSIQLPKRNRKAIGRHVKLLTAFLSAGCIFTAIFAALAVYAPSVSSFSVPFCPDAADNATVAAEVDDNHVSDPVVGASTSGQERQRRTASNPDYMLRRFPRYGTDGFSKRCNWTDGMVESQKADDCLFLVRPDPTSNEGIAEWVANIAHGYIFAVQLGCRLVLDYGPDVDLERVLVPADGRGKNNWTLPRNLDTCHGSQGCHKTSASWKEKNLVAVRKAIRRTRGEGALPGPESLASFPHYRFVYMFYEKGTIKDEEIRKIETVLPGFSYESGMACAMEATFDLSPTASAFVPNLFTRILPALRDESALVIALYIRTGRTDSMVKLEKEGGKVDHQSDVTRLIGMNEKILDCALNIERDYLSRGSFTRTVWMVTSDSPNIGRTVVSLYDGKHVNVTEANSSADAVIRREVLITAARGVQTKPQRGPQTKDFAEAVIDWWLLGESDFVVALGSFSFASTAALRTARPVYVVNRDGCWKRKLPSSIDNKTDNFPAYQW